MRYLARVLGAATLLVASGAAWAATQSLGTLTLLPAGSAPQNTLVVQGAAAQGQTNYPMTFGRPFVDGAIPHSPVVLVNGVAVPSQADVKNRYPDGSVEFAVVSAVVPQVSPSDCTIIAASPAEAPPYALWPAHGNSPVFTIGRNPTQDPVWQALETDHCHKFDVNVPRTSFGVEYPDHAATSSVPAGGLGFTEEPTHYEANGIGQAADYPAPTQAGLIYTCGPWTGPGVPTTYSNPGILIGCDIEGGGGNSAVTIPPNHDIVYASSYQNGTECIQVAGQGTTPSCAPSLVNPLNTQGNYAWGPDGDHNVNYEGGDTAFDNIFVQGVLPQATINAVNAAQAAYYATPGSPSPVECSMPGMTCSIAVSFTHKMVATATTPYQLYNISAGTYRDADFDVHGNADTAADLAFCGTVSNCRYMKAYDQTVEGQSGRGPQTLTFADSTAVSTPMTLAQMETLLPPGVVTMTLTPNTGTVGTADAGVMLAAGSCTPWTSGSVAQTMICADDTAARKYDIGFGDGFHPFRPRFYVTFWPGISRVYVRAVGENGLTTEGEDLKYKLATSDGYTADLSGTQTTNPKIHNAYSKWTHTWWIGGAPVPSVNIDYGLAYLDSTRFFPNFDTSLVFAPPQISNAYGQWANGPHDLYDGYWDGGGASVSWEQAMGTAGDDFHIGPYPISTSFWLHSPDWRYRAIALNMTDVAAAWPINFRESDPTRIFQRGDAAGSGTGLGRVMSASGRPTLNAYSTDPDNLVDVGAIGSSVWTADDAHQPSIFYPAYVMTGDPWYLDMLYAWAGWTVFEDAGGDTYDCLKQTTNCSIFRGPTGAYGGMFGSKAARAIAWTLRGRAETAFAAPDGTPEKNYFRYMTNDAIAKWEGGLGITGTPFDTATVKQWVLGTDFPDYEGSWDVQSATTPPPLGNMACGGNTPPAPLSNELSLADQQTIGLVPGADGCFDDPWMNYYLEYAVGRAVELGFAMKPIQAVEDSMPIGIIASSAPWFLNAYVVGAEKAAGGYWPTWAAYYAGGEDPTYLANLQAAGTSMVANGGYLVTIAPGLASAVDQGVSGATAAWAWYQANVYNIATNNGDWSVDPRWSVIPRTDTNVLPAQSTVTPP